MDSKQPHKPRLSLTKTQIQSGVGAELLALCQSVTEDGSLSKEEIIALRSWLKAHRSSDLPAVGFLASTVERIVADGKVTKQERRELYHAIETILPPEARKHAAAQRRVVEAEAMAREHAQSEAERQQEREERERNRPLCSANFMVAGVHYEGRPEVIRQYAEDGAQVFLARDRQNQYSRNAVEIRLQNGMQIGYVPEDDAGDIAPLLDQGSRHQACITKILTGGRVPIPVVQAYIYRADADNQGTVSAADVPEKQFHFGGKAYESSRRSGCLSVFLLAILPLLGLASILGLWG
jgi:HIRAN domain